MVQTPPPATDGGQGVTRIRAAIEGALAGTTVDRKSISVTVRRPDDRSPTLLQVSGSADSALAAQQATRRVVASIIDANPTVAERQPATPGVQFRIVEAATLPNAPSRETPQYATVGGVIGVLAGTVIALAKRRARHAR